MSYNNDASSNKRKSREMPDLYGVLGLEHTATTLQITQAYKMLSRSFHPDKQPLLRNRAPRNDDTVAASESVPLRPDNEDTAQATFVRIKQAHDVLVDRVLRFAYDHGGFPAVVLVQRSQARATRRQDEEQNDRSSDEHEENDDDEEENLYQQIQSARSHAQALRIVRRIVRAHQAHEQQQEQAGQVPNVETNLTLQNCYHPNPFNNPLQYYHHGSTTGAKLPTNEATTLVVEATQPLLSPPTTTIGPVNLSVQCTAQLSSSRAATMVGHMGLAYQNPSGTTHVQALVGVPRLTTTAATRPQTAATGRDNTNTLASSPSSRPQITVQTSRRLSDKSLWTVGAGGSLAGRQTWMATLASSRVVLWKTSPLFRQSRQSSQSSPSSSSVIEKLHASVRCGIGLARGDFQSLMAQVKSLHFPQWQCRLGLGGTGTPLLKLSYQTAAQRAIHATWSWHWLWWKVKVTKEDELFWADSGADEDEDLNWTIRYGLKYDTRGAVLGQPWTLVLHLRTAACRFHLPIFIMPSTGGGDWPVRTVLAFLVGRCLDDWWEDYSSKSLSSFRQNTSRDPSVLSTTTTCLSHFRPVLGCVAQDKRAREAQARGLVFLTAVWSDFFAQSPPSSISSSAPTFNKEKDDNDVTDLLQYWTVDGSLRLLTSRAHWTSPWIVSTATEDDNPTALLSWWKWLKEMYSTWHHWGAEQPLEETLYVRYQYRGRIYEVELSNSETELVFPHPQATEMGDASFVA